MSIGWKEYNRMTTWKRIKYYLSLYRERSFEEQRFLRAFQYVINHEDRLSSIDKIAIGSLKKKIMRMKK